MQLNKSIKQITNPNTPYYWDKLYEHEISADKIRCDETLIKIIPLLQNKNSILDFGCGTGGNVKLLSQYLHSKQFYLLDHSSKAIDFIKTHLLKEADENNNRFFYYSHIDNIANQKFDAIISIQVIEHITDYKTILDKLWNSVSSGGILIISVPVKGWWDRHREHINKFTIKKMLKILWQYSNWVNVAPRSYSKRSQKLATAFFVLNKHE